MLGLRMEEVVVDGHGRSRLYAERDIIVTGADHSVDVREWQTTPVDGLADDDVRSAELSSEDETASGFHDGG